MTETVPHVVQVRRRFKQPTGGQAAHVAQPKSDTWRLQGERGRSRPEGEAARVRDIGTGAKQGPRECLFVSLELARTQKQAHLGEEHAVVPYKIWS